MTRTAAAIGRQNRQKGNRWRKVVCDRLSAATGRKFVPEHQETTEGRFNDVREMPNEEPLLPLVVEARRTKALPLRKTMQDVADMVARASPGHYGIAYVHIDGEGRGKAPLEVVIMDADTFDKLLGLIVRFVWE